MFLIGALCPLRKNTSCALKIKELGFKKVVIGAMDSHDKVNGKGKRSFRMPE
jgi:diaminohydroxyphosphoribosylaminopyrimidine deaminase/5-amino-6-(5-phosphoribosylamino)uracil reductase